MIIDVPKFSEKDDAVCLKLVIRGWVQFYLLLVLGANLSQGAVYYEMYLYFSLSQYQKT